MAPLAQVVDQLRDLAQDELPSPRTCKVRLWDDGTFDVVVYHSMGDDEMQWLRYERTTSELVWAHAKGAHTVADSLTGNETVYEPAYDDLDVRVLATVDPPYE